MHNVEFFPISLHPFVGFDFLVQAIPNLFAQRLFFPNIRIHQILIVTHVIKVHYSGSPVFLSRPIC